MSARHYIYQNKTRKIRSSHTKLRLKPSSTPTYINPINSISSYRKRGLLDLIARLHVSKPLGMNCKCERSVENFNSFFGIFKKPKFIPMIEKIMHSYEVGLWGANFLFKFELGNERIQNPKYFAFKGKIHAYSTTFQNGKFRSWWSVKAFPSLLPTLQNPIVINLQRN